MHVNKDELCANVRDNTRCEGVLFTYATRDAGRSWYQYFRDRLADKIRVHGSAVDKRLFLHEFKGRLTIVTVGHVDGLFYEYDTRCKTTKALPEAIVIEFNMSWKAGRKSNFL